jgi:hypothetical protein
MMAAFFALKTQIIGSGSTNIIVKCRLGGFFGLWREGALMTSSKDLRDFSIAPVSVL